MISWKSWDYSVWPRLVLEAACPPLDEAFRAGWMGFDNPVAPLTGQLAAFSPGMHPGRLTGQPGSLEQVFMGCAGHSQNIP
ncbi:MAG TPA: hypothetical protein VII93_04350 [Anaerolineales bacterium]